MTIDEGGVPKGGLSDYVSGKLRDIAEQKAEAERPAREVKDKDLDIFIQRTASLRKYLVEQVGEIDELLEHFRIRELLEEAKNNISKLDVVKNGYEKEPIIRQEFPSFYTQIVNPATPIESFKLQDEEGMITQVSLDQLVDPINFLRIIPRLDGYGLALERTVRTSITVPVSVTVPAEGTYHHDNASGSSYYTGGGYSTYRDHMPINVEATRTMAVESVRSKLSGSKYDLFYSYHLNRRDLTSYPRRYRGKKAIFVEDTPRHLDTYLTPKTRILANQPQETLIQMIGDQVVKELLGPTYV